MRARAVLQSLLLPLPLILLMVLGSLDLAADPDPESAQPSAPDAPEADEPGRDLDGDGEGETDVEPAAAIREHRNLVYARAGVANRPLRLNLFLPAAPTNGAADGPYRLIVMFHGGSYMGGNPEVMDNFCRALVAEGFACATAQYRLVPYQLPDMVADAKAAIRWLRGNAETYHLDAHNVAALGHSAGGSLSMMLGVTPNEPDREPGGQHRDQSSAVQAVITLAGVSDFGREAPEMLERLDRSPLPAKNFLMGDWGIEKGSPARLVNRGDAPVLAIHDVEDGTVPFAQSELIIKACKEHDVPCELCKREGCGHNFIFHEAHRADAVKVITAFLNKHLTNSPEEAEDDF